MICVSWAGVAVARSADKSECGAGGGAADVICDVGQRLTLQLSMEQLRRRRGLQYLKLQALHLVSKGLGGHIDIRSEAEKWRNMQTEEIQLHGCNKRPKVVLPGRGNLQPHLLHRKGIARDAGHHSANVL